jgi:methyl-accepting chemotaxis protein
MSHKIAGPLYKLRVFLQKAREGKLQESLKFRKGDHFTELADDYNAMVKSFRDLTNENVETVTTAIARIENALGKTGVESRGEIEQALAELRSVRGRISL